MTASTTPDRPIGTLRADETIIRKSHIHGLGNISKLAEIAAQRGYEPAGIVHRGSYSFPAGIQFHATVQDLVTEFHEAFRAPVADSPTLIPDERSALRGKLIAEELGEYLQAVIDGDLVEIADALGDLAYVVYGSAVEHGINLDAIVARIHQSNMSKLDENGQTVPHPTIPGKIGKSDHYQPPTDAIRAELQRQGAAL